jgi:hypothetical protein
MNTASMPRTAAMLRSASRVSICTAPSLDWCHSRRRIGSAPSAQESYSSSHNMSTCNVRFAVWNGF